ncbi:MAG TPA: monovalent cation/H(+) antiporter subunit G [Terriglobales bacterium]|nr:monovalent cation/H(+) antiporter subunit G [Terriglobales bacterium]
MKTAVIYVLIAASVVVTVVSVVGMLRVRDPYQRMHYISPPASLSALFIAVAIFLERGFKPEFFKAAFVVVILVGMNTVVTHSAARAFRIAEIPDWDPKNGEEVPTKPSDEEVKGE